MRPTPALALSLAVLGAAVLAGVRAASAEDPPCPPLAPNAPGVPKAPEAPKAPAAPEAPNAPADGGHEMRMQAPLVHPFLDALVGSWTTESDMGGMKGKGKVTYAKGVGGTALVSDYENVSPAMSFYGHGVYKLAGDGKTLNLWWFDNSAEGTEPMKISGPITEKGCDLTSSLPDGSVFRITMTRHDAGVTFKMFVGDALQMTDEYRRAR
jgi:hypothetical protein